MRHGRSSTALALQPSQSAPHAHPPPTPPRRVHRTAHALRLALALRLPPPGGGTQRRSRGRAHTWCAIRRSESRRGAHSSHHSARAAHRACGHGSRGWLGDVGEGGARDVERGGARDVERGERPLSPARTPWPTRTNEAAATCRPSCTMEPYVSTHTRSCHARSPPCAQPRVRTARRRSRRRDTGCDPRREALQPPLFLWVRAARLSRSGPLKSSAARRALPRARRAERAHGGGP